MSSTPNPIRVFLVENHTLVRAGIRILLEGLPGVTVVGEASSGPDALAQFAKLPAKNLPDIALVDLAMQGMSGMEVTEKMQELYPSVKVLILTMHASEEYVLQALRAGAAGYMLKDVTPEELLLAMHNALRGDIPLSPAVSRHVIADYIRRVGAVGILPDGRLGPRTLSTGLTPRQRQILALITEGLSTKDIAARLNLSAKTIETHRAAMMERLGIHDVASLVRHAIKIGLVPPEE